MVGGAVYVVQAGVERSSSRGWRDLAEQRASAVTDLTVRMGNLESQVKTLRTQNEGLLELNLRYQQELATLRGEVAGLRAALAARR
jgi:predicted RNase H-like nuclease (RuvC/YqgF family)